MKPKITSAAVTGRLAEPMAGVSPDTHLREAAIRWQHQWPEGSTQWSQRPDGLVADFMKASARDMLAMHGQQGVVRASQVLATQLALLGRTSMDVSCMWIEGRANIRMVLSFVPASEMAPTGSVDLQVQATAGQDPEDVLEDVQQEMRKWTQSSAEVNSTGSMIFDPLETLPDKAIAQLASRIEKECGLEDHEVMIAGSALLLVWQSMEACRANTFSLSINGLSYDGESLMPGMEARFVAAAKLMDEVISVDAPGDEQDQNFNVAFRKARLQ